MRTYGIKLTFLALCLAGCSRQSPAQGASQAKPNWEVLGVHIGDTMGAARAVLKQRGFSIASANCSDNLKTFFDKMIKEGKTGVSRNDSTCEEGFSKDKNNGVSLNLIMSPEGYVVSEVIYSFPTSEQTTVVAELTRKFGKPSETYRDGTTAWSEVSNDRGIRKRAITYSPSSGSDMLDLHAGYDWEEAQAARTSKLLLRKSGRGSPQL